MASERVSCASGSITHLTNRAGRRDVIPMLRATFSLAQANALVPYLTAQFDKMRKLSDELRLLKSRVRDEARQRRAGERLQPSATSSMIARMEELERELRASIEETTQLGIEVRRVDGLCDFPHWLEGQLVYLCWKFGESEISHYHSTSSGFDGRRPIPTGGPSKDMN